MHCGMDFSEGYHKWLKCKTFVSDIHEVWRERAYNNERKNVSKIR